MLHPAVDLRPKPHVLHGLEYPHRIQDKAIVWIDTKWAQRDFEFHEKGSIDDAPRFTNPKEVDLVLDFVTSLRRGPLAESEDKKKFEVACLAPYKRQVFEFNQKFEPTSLPEGFVLMPPSKRSASGLAQFAHTVDSFQGNQADIVVLSLVRNNLQPQEEKIGFLKDASRLNVMLSRAKRLLVICGSWEFFYKATRYAVSEADSTWHWMQVLKTLEQMFGGGEAARISMDEYLD